ncbi:glycoside hydrolase family 32 protein [Pedobacter sp. BS3]|uniref:glycoside hydrolase family 32 protein n=1 Tax=Pedobacter sp. BS3 TaxID=2567937 RepID=UPI0011EE5A49|nr:glycoside hydrolase family 32 protein [Pedobacter sp. BS3]TZF82087.1 glycoside hydrolase family 32 protein [Pedobacter sp. BS3]
MIKAAGLTFIVAVMAACSSLKNNRQEYKEPYRLQFHFSPKAKWVNDPNGMVYLNGKYHLFFQYYPDSTVWGPMHWAHAVSKDLMHWEQLPIALYPDSLGWIFSGSAVYDKDNTSGFAKDGKMPLVAIFTHHNPKLEKAGRKDFQYQSIAYSLDEGTTWTKYAGNPVLKNPGITDFRDPKVIWYAPGKKWVMTLATKDHVTFYSSPDLKNWTKESEFGQQSGAHGGVWECPDLFSIKAGGKEHWVLLVSVNPGAPNGGSGTQYFIGNFDGHTFTSTSATTKWLDYGTDNYAGVTWSNTGDNRIFIGWMNNWQYANRVPTQVWRGATTLPRTLELREVDGAYFLSAMPVNTFNTLRQKEVRWQNIRVNDSLDISAKVKNFKDKFVLQFKTTTLADFAIKLSNTTGEQLIVGYDKQTNSYYIDRTKSGETSFETGFAKKIVAPRISQSGNITGKLVIDAASAELFADDGLTNQTAVFFPGKPYTALTLLAGNLNMETLSYAPINSIWP